MQKKYQLEQLEKRINYSFKNKELLSQAMTHSSFANEQKINKMEDYERLEFLGDAVLELIASEFVYLKNPEDAEGVLTKRRSSMVCEPSLAYCAKELELGKFLLLGKGENSTGGRNRDSLIADAMESLIGAIYLDGGFASAKEFIDKFIFSDLDEKRLFYDSKTILQEMVQGNDQGRVHYELIGEEGPDHNKTFVTAVFINGVDTALGEGRTKKAAEQQAAYEAIQIIRKK